MHPDRFAIPAASGDGRARSVRLAHERFVSSHHASPVVRPLVAESWARSAGGGATADGSRLPDVRLASGELGGYRAEHPLAVLLPLFRDLLGRAARDEEYIFAVADIDGTLLWVEGDRAVMAAAARMNFVEGAVWTEAQAGTNAPGTALAVERPVQIVGSEHYNAVVHPWSCCAVPIHDTDGRMLGVVDITGDEKVAAPHALALVRAAARAAETELARRYAAADGRALRGYLDLLDTSTNRPAALLTGGGRVLHTADGVDPSGLADLVPVTPGPLVLPDGRLAMVEPIGGDGHLLMRVAGSTRSPREQPPLRLTALGRDHALLEVDGRTHRLSRRHSEVVMALSLMAGGMSGGRLAVELSDAEIPLVNLRVEMSRLRALLGPQVLGSRPYELCRSVRSDFADLRDLLAAGRVEEAVGAYAGPLLPWSDAPVIVEFREALEQQLRGAVLASGGPALLRRWVDAPWGANDAQAWRALADNLPGGSAQRAAAAGRARALLGQMSGTHAGRGSGRAA
jgi:hypothetical protein